MIHKIMNISTEKIITKISKLLTTTELNSSSVSRLCEYYRIFLIKLHYIGKVMEEELL